MHAGGLRATLRLREIVIAMRGRVGPGCRRDEWLVRGYDGAHGAAANKRKTFNVLAGRMVIGQFRI